MTLIDRARYVKPGEALAMASTRLHHDRKGFFWMLGPGILPNERPSADVVVVHVRGELEHHKDGGSESYEGILEKMRAAYAGESINEEGETVSAPPKAIIFCLDSPGGVVSGLNECVAELQRMRAANPAIKVTCFVNEMAASAAYALACSCSEIVCPPSAIIGSIGVISTMVSQAARDKKEGFDVRLLTSGARKADGHPHAPINDAALAVETERVEKLALAFFQLAGRARGLSIEKLRSFQAGIFLGKDAIRVKLADRLGAYSDLLAGAQAGATGLDPGGSNQIKGTRMNLTSLIKKTKAALAKEDDPKKIVVLSNALASYAASIEAYKKTEKHIEHVKTEEGDEDEDEDDKPEDGEDEKAKAAAAAEDEEKAKAAATAESEDEESEGKSAQKALALVQSLTGMKGKKALGALRAMAMTAATTAADVATLKREGAASKKAGLIASAKGKYLTASESKWLATQDMETVEGFVEMRQKAGVIVNTDETTIVKPASAKPGTEESLPDFVRTMIDDAVASMPSAKREQGRKELVEAHLKSHNEQLAHALNGAADGRY